MSRAHMLLVEDDAALAELLIWHFRKEDFDVAHTVDGEEALILAQEQLQVGAFAAQAGQHPRQQERGDRRDHAHAHLARQRLAAGLDKV